MEQPQNEQKQQFDFIGSLAKKAMESEATQRGPAGKAVNEAIKNLSEVQKQSQEEFKKERNWQIKVANNIEQSATDKEKEAAAAGIDGARKLIDEYRSLKGFTYNDLLKAGGYTQELPQEKMGTAEVITRLSMAILPGLAGFLAGTKSANPYIMAAGGAEAGVKGLQYLDELDKEKRKRASDRQMAGAKATMQEAQDERRMMREALLMPQKARLEAQELGRQLQLTAAKESLGRVFEPRKETPEEVAARERLRQATELEQSQLRESGKKPKASTAQDAVDRQYAKEYVEYTAQGGYASTQKGIQELQEAISELNTFSGDKFGVTGKWTVLTPNLLSSRREEIRSKIESAIQNTLKPILGAQFARVEGEQIFKRAFDPRQEEDVNIARVSRELERLKKRIEAAEMTKEYYEEFGTLRGYRGPSFRSTGEEAPAKESGGFIKPTADSLKKLSPEEKRQYVQGDRETQQRLLK